MELYGTDKPDLRIPGPVGSSPVRSRPVLTGQIYRVDPYLGNDFVGMITKLENPIVEAWKLSLGRGQDANIKEIRAFVKNFMEKLPTMYTHNPDGGPQILIFDPTKPMCGFSSLGPGGLDNIMAISHN